jgi:tRNA(fMet)-specific endonuclease VapC
MKRYLLDTSLLAGFFHHRQKAVELIALWLQHHTVATSMLVYGEVIEYLKGLPNFPAHYATFHKILAEIPLTYPILDRYAEIRRTLRPLHQDIGDIDTLIAATAIEQNLTLVTIDRDFDRVPHLKWKLVNLKAA